MRFLGLFLLLLSPAFGQPLLETPPGPPPPVATRARIDAAIPMLEALVAKTMRETGVPGLAIGIVFRGQTVYMKGFGVRELGQPAKVDPDTVFQLASVSKAIASTVVGKLVQEKVVSWDTPANLTLADPWVSSHVALADLFSHRSGLPDHAGDLLEDLGYSRDEVLRRLRYLPLAPFRITYAYTNFGLTAGAVAAAQATGLAWEDLCAEKLYKPLGMTSTSSRYADYEARPNRAVLHRQVGGRWVVGHRDADAQSPAGGVSSSVRDLTSWLKLQLGLQDATHQPQVLLHPPFGFYGLGWNVGVDNQGRLRLNHSGAFMSGAGTYAVLVPGDQLGLVALSNGEPHGVPEAMCNAFLEQVLEGKVRHDWVTLRRQLFAPMYPQPAYLVAPAQPAPARGSYGGEYTNEFYGPARVVESGGQLTLELGPAPQRYPLRHWEGEKFVFQTTGENQVGLTGVTFTPTSFTVEYLNENGLGTFIRRP